MKREKNTNIKKEKEINCIKCRAEFDVWLANSNFSMDVEKRVRERFYNYCGICKKDKKEKKGRFKEV